MFQKRGSENLLSRGKFLMAITTLVGTIVGAGILGIPYVVAKAGLLYGLLLILTIGIGFIFLNLFAGEFILRTKEQHQLTGYAEKYLGKKGKMVMAFSLIFSIYGALTAYLIGEGATINSIITTLFGKGSGINIFSLPAELIYSLLFFVVAFLIIFHGIKAAGKTELILISLLTLVVIFISIFSYNKVNYNNFSLFNPAYFFMPYGIIIFAFLASPAIPEVQEVLGKNKKLMKRTIIIGSIIPIVLYLLFAFSVSLVVGLGNFELLQPNERIATIALSLYSHPFLGVAANLLAVLAMFTSFLTLGIALIEVYHYDYKLPLSLSMLLTFSLPLLIVIFNLTSFIIILGLTGAIAGGLDGIMIILMYWKSKVLGNRKPEYTLKPHRVLGTAFIILLSLGIIYQIWINFF